MADTFGHMAGSSSGPEPEIEALTEIPAEPAEVVLAEEAMAENNVSRPGYLHGGLAPYRDSQAEPTSISSVPR
jgi:hypothetical protein